jgi:hypothetical protein
MKVLLLDHLLSIVDFGRGSIAIGGGESSWTQAVGAPESSISPHANALSSEISV